MKSERSEFSEALSRLTVRVAVVMRSVAFEFGRFLRRMYDSVQQRFQASKLASVQCAQVPAASAQAQERFWLMSGDTPTGPFDSSQVQSKLATSEITLSAKVCPVGGDSWKTIADVPFLIATPDAEATASLASEPAPLDSFATATATPGSDATATVQPLAASQEPVHANDLLLGYAVLGVIAVTVIGVIWWWITPLSPRDVVRRFNDADNLSEAMTYTTMNMHPALRELAKQKDFFDSNPESEYEILEDRPAPPTVGGRYVGCRGQHRDPTTKQVNHLDAYFHLLDVDGWKIEDFYFTSLNGQPLDRPISMAHDYRLMSDETPAAHNSSRATNKPWYEDRSTQNNVARTTVAATRSFWKSGGGKALMAFIAAVLAGIGAVLFKVGGALFNGSKS